MKLCKKALSLQKEHGGFTLQTDACTFRLIFVTKDILRIRAGFTGDFKEESYTLMMTAWEDRMDPLFTGERTRVEPAAAELTETEESYTLQSDGLRAVITKAPFRIKIYDAEGTLLHADLPDIGWAQDNNLRRSHTSEILDGDHFYGFGETTGPIEKTHQRMRQAPNDTMGYDPQNSDSLYKHIPFYVKLNAHTHKAVGYYYQTTWACEFDMGKAHSNYWAHHSKFTTDGGDVDLFFINGPAISDVLRRFTGLTGRPALLPKTALGYLASSMYYPELPENVDTAIRHFLDIAEREDIPVSGFQLSSGYCEEDGKRYVFTWNPEKFPDPARYLRECEARGVVNSPNVKPGVLTTHPKYDEWKQKNLFVKDRSSAEPAVGKWWGGEGAYVDLTNPRSRELWSVELRHSLLDLGARSIWNDNCEYEGLYDDDARVDFEGEGATIGQLRTQMALLMCMVTERSLRSKDANRRPYIVCRSGCEGIQRYAQTWAGDNKTAWETLRSNVATILGMGLSGCPNEGADVGGFYGPAPSPELLVRWVQNGIFMPRFSIHSTNTDNTVTEPWMYPSVTPLVRDAIHFRYAMMPYLYSVHEHAHETGEPMMRPVFYEYPEDEAGYTNGTDFFLGHALLVCNVLEKGAKTRHIRFPQGNTFYDFQTRKAYEGGTEVDVPVELSTVPMYLAGGSVFAMEKDTQLHLIVAPDHDTTFALYEDDGTSNDYQKGDYRKTTFQVTSGDAVTVNASVEGNYESTYTEVLFDVIAPNRAPLAVTMDTTELTHYLYRPDFDEAESGWYYDMERRSALLKVRAPERDYTVTISFTPNDLLGM